MEFLDPKKQKQHLTRLFIGYFLVGVALILTTVILLYRANGFGLKDGQVIQNGLIFVSSKPTGAEIYVNGEKREESTNVRLLMPAGQYAFELRKDGYRPWKRAINIEGGSVARFDYPLLFPTKIESTAVKKYDIKPALVTQSPDQRWLVVQAGAAYNIFDVYDLTKPDKAPVVLTVPESISKLKGTHSWKVLEWANDNSHFLLQHITDEAGKVNSEYVLVNRENPANSVNLTNTLGTNPAKLELRDKKHDKYLLYSDVERKLYTASISEPQPELLLDHVFGYKSHGEDVVLYATDQGAPAGKAVIKLREGSKNYTIRQVAGGAQYTLDVARYDGDWYIVAGAPSENRTYVYKNPAGSLSSKPDQALVPVQVLKAANPQYIAFSGNARFVVVQGGQQFSVYDAETEKGYNYTVDTAIDAAQPNAAWMDSYRLTFSSSGQAVVFDFDKTNEETLVASDASYRPYFDRDFKALYTIAPQITKAADGKETTQFTLSSSSLRLPQDK